MTKHFFVLFTLPDNIDEEEFITVAMEDFYQANKNVYNHMDDVAYQLVKPSYIKED